MQEREASHTPAKGESKHVELNKSIMESSDRMVTGIIRPLSIAGLFHTNLYPQTTVSILPRSLAVVQLNLVPHYAGVYFRIDPELPILDALRIVSSACLRMSAVRAMENPMQYVVLLLLVVLIANAGFIDIQDASHYSLTPMKPNFSSAHIHGKIWKQSATVFGKSDYRYAYSNYTIGSTEVEHRQWWTQRQRQQRPHLQLLRRGYGTDVGVHDWRWSTILPLKNGQYKVEFCFADQTAKDKLHLIMCHVSKPGLYGTPKIMVCIGDGADFTHRQPIRGIARCSKSRASIC
jgi:hypothetical protein